MHCTPFLGGFVCGRKPRGKRIDCFSAPNGCTKESVVKCDAPVGDGKTCDRHCCRDHSKHVGQDKDFCLEHWVKMGKPTYAP
jgi:hypothetical protein